MREAYPVTYEEIYSYVTMMNSILPSIDGSIFNMSHVYAIAARYRDTKQTKSFRDFLYEDYLRNKNIREDDSDNLWLVHWYPDITREFVFGLDKNGKPIREIHPVLPKFPSRILDINAINYGWRGSWKENMRRYLLVSGNEEKRSMLEAVLKEINKCAQ